MKMKYSVVICLAIAGFVMTSFQGLAQTSVTLNPMKDNTVYESNTGGLSNGVGTFLFAGQTFSDRTRRAVLSFDIAGSVPAGMEIDSVILTLHLSRTISAPQTINVHKVLADWGEGTSNAAGEEGAGTPSTAGDATWTHRFFNTTFWTTAGGDFSATVTASQTVGDSTQLGFYTWGSTAQMVADVQDWLDNPANNFGWILVGNEAAFPTTKRFDSREHATVANRPALTVFYHDPDAIPCGDFTSLLARCVGGGTVQARVTLLNSTIHAGKTVSITIDADSYTATIVTNGTHSRAQVSVGGYAVGDHTVTLADPPGCLTPRVVTCTAGLTVANRAWDVDDARWSATAQKAATAKLLGNYPNPFNPSTTINYSLSTDTWVTLKVYNLLGQEVVTLLNEFQTAGQKSASWDGRDSRGNEVPGGVFIYTIHAGDVTISEKMIIVK
jgi:hypothetical protein